MGGFGLPFYFSKSLPETPWYCRRIITRRSLFLGSGTVRDLAPLESFPCQWNNEVEKIALSIHNNNLISYEVQCEARKIRKSGTGTYFPISGD
jgi:hypothetical protein